MPLPLRPSYEGLLTPAIEEFVYSLVLELPTKSISAEQIDDLLKCPVVKAPITVITLLGLSYFGEYQHKDENIQAFVRKSFARMSGSIRTIYAQLFSAFYVGTAVAEWGIKPDGKQWVLDAINVLKPGKYTFLGTRGNITGVRYYSYKQIDIDYAQILHVINNPHLSFGTPGGVSDLESAVAAVKAWKILMSELVIAGQRQATPLTAGFYDPDAADTILYNEDGSVRIDEYGEQMTETPQAQMSKQLSGIENKTTVVTSANNRIEAVATQADVRFFTEGLRVCHKLIFMSFLFPETGLEVVAGGGGDSHLNKGHMALLRLNVEQLANQIKNVFLEQMIRPYIEWNFGAQEDWGEFPSSPGQEEERIPLFNALVSALYQQIFSVDDLAVINKLYELAGLPPVDKLPTPPEAPPPDTQTKQGFSLGLTDLDFAYWRQFETNGNTHT